MNDGTHTPPTLPTETAYDEEARPLGSGILVAMVATLVMTVSYVDRQALAAVATTVREDLHISHAGYGLMGSAFAIAYLVGAPLAGILLDRVGARWGLVFAVLAWSTIAAAHSRARSFASLFIMRVGLGLAESPSFPGAAQAVRVALPPRLRSAGFGLLFTGSSIGAMIAAPAAISLSQKYNWQTAFVLTALMGLAWIPLWILVTAFFGKSMRGNPAARAADAAPYSLREVDSRPLLARGVMWRAMVMIIASAPAIMIVLQWFPQYLVESRGANLKALASVLWIPPLAFDAGAISFGALGSAMRQRDGSPPKILLPIAAALAATLALLPFFRGIPASIAFASISMAGGAGVYALATSELMSRVRENESSRAGGLSAAAQSIAHIITGPLVGLAVDRTHSYKAVMLILGAILIPGATAWTLWPKSSPTKTAT